MTCFSPIEIMRPSGLYQKVPCKQCNGCRIQRSKEWAIRCSHEAKIHGDNNAFLTLTYNNDHLPKDHSLNHEHFQKFIRSLRQRTGLKLRYYMCGEYGKATKANKYIARPHFHAILFGHSFPDRTNHKLRKAGKSYNQTYRSEILEKSWDKGFSEIGTVTFKSCAYVSRYILKKQKGEENYAIIDHDTGEITYKKSEYTCMSLKPGIGLEYYKKWEHDIFPNDYVMLEPGKKLGVPQYYKNQFKKDNPKMAKRLTNLRIAQSLKSPDRKPDRLAVRNQILNTKIEKLKRNLE